MRPAKLTARQRLELIVESLDMVVNKPRKSATLTDLDRKFVGVAFGEAKELLAEAEKPRGLLSRIAHRLCMRSASLRYALRGW